MRWAKEGPGSWHHSSELWTFENDLSSTILPHIVILMCALGGSLPSLHYDHGRWPIFHEPLGK